MGHNIEIREIEGVRFESFVAREPAWHGLGAITGKGLTAKEAIEFCNANYSVETRPLFAMTHAAENLIVNRQHVGCEDEFYADWLSSGNMGEPSISDVIKWTNGRILKELGEPNVTSHKATMRMDFEEVLGIVGSKYGVVQNVDAFNFVDLLTTGEIGGEKATIEAAGVLGMGERIFITAKFPEPIRMDNKEGNNVEMFVVFTTSHDGSGAVTCMMTPTRVVCQNTLNMAFRDAKSRISIRHTSNASTRLKDSIMSAHMAFGTYETYRDRFETTMRQLASKKVTDKEVEALFAKIMMSDESFKVYAETGNLMHEDISSRSRNKTISAIESLHNGIGQSDLEKGTAYWVMNGLSTHYQNHQKFGSLDDMFESINNGRVRNELQEMFQLVG